MEPLILPIIDIIDFSFYQLKENHLYSTDDKNNHIFIYCEEGNILLCKKEKEIRISTGQCYILETCCLSKIKIKKHSKLFYVDFFLEKEENFFLKTLIDSTLSVNNICLQRIYAMKNEANLDYQTIFMEKKNFNTKNSIESYLVTLYFMELLFLLKKTNDRKKTSNLKSDSTQEEDLVNQITNFMGENLHLSLSINDLSETFFVSPSYLKHIFKKNTGYSLINYFRTLKIEQAKYWLREGTYSVTEIAEKLGFESIHYFSRSFKNFVGFSPTIYQKSFFLIENELDDLV